VLQTDFVRQLARRRSHSQGRGGLRRHPAPSVLSL
jgi:hypothetical protein